MRVVNPTVIFKSELWQRPDSHTRRDRAGPIVQTTLTR